MYRLATKCTTKNATNLSPNTQLSRSSAVSRLVKNDTVPLPVPSADCTCTEVCGLRICRRRCCAHNE